MRRLVICVLVLLAAAASARSQDGDENDRVSTLEKRMEDMEKRHRAETRKLRDRIAELEKGGEPRSELEAEVERLIRDADDEAASGAREPHLPRQTFRANLFNPRITVFADFVGRLDSGPVFSAHDHGHGGDEHEEDHEEEEHDDEEHEEDEHGHEDDGPRADDRFSLREVELDLRADIDPYAKGALILAFEEEGPGEYEFHVEEGYLTLETLPWNLRAKIGRFRTAFGVINRLHLHDLPQVDYPLPVRAYLGAHGDAQTGVHVSWLPPEVLSFTPEITLEVLNGENSALLAGADAKDPAYIGRLQLFRDLGPGSFLQFGTSHLVGETNRHGNDLTWLAGVDALYKWRDPGQGENRSFVAQGELFILSRDTGEETIDSLGAYAFVQYQPLRSWFFGVRGDWAESPEDEDDEAWSLGAYASYYTTEFLRFRLGYEYLDSDDRDEALHSLFLQITWVFGSHPAEPYWFNK
jgi:hypothetical protein